jgi:NAD(P)-dependent dehydrogenase (short-subunit alcohol dehydrogenase family)
VFEVNNHEQLTETAIVTGASKGIGAGIAKGFVEGAFNVVPCGACFSWNVK